MKRRLMLWLVCLFAGVNLALAQTSNVTGVVTSSESGEPVVGASVLVLDTNMGVITDIDGKFVISNVPSNAKTLRISFVGMQSQDVHINRNRTMYVVLHTNAELLE